MTQTERDFVRATLRFMRYRALLVEARQALLRATGRTAMGTRADLLIAKIDAALTDPDFPAHT